MTAHNNCSAGSAELAARLRAQIGNDHARGCAGRTYSCDCGYDLSTEGMLEMAAEVIESINAPAQPVAWTNKEQLGFLKSREYDGIPMAMWSQKGAMANIPLYAAQPPAAPVETNADDALAERFTDACFDGRADGASWSAVYQNMLGLIEYIRAVPQPPLRREAIKRAIYPFCFNGKNSDAIADVVLALMSAVPRTAKVSAGTDDDRRVEDDLNMVADEVAREGMSYRAARIRQGAIQLAFLRHSRTAAAAQPAQPSDKQIDAVANDYAQRWCGDDFALMDDDDKAELRIEAHHWLKCWFAVAAQPPAAPVETKTVYVKRWRTLVNLPAKYADEIVEALRAPAQCSAATEDVAGAAQFLLDRLDEFDPGDDEPEREYHGHVTPAIARLRSALTEAVPQGVRK